MPKGSKRSGRKAAAKGQARGKDSLPAQSNTVDAHRMVKLFYRILDQIMEQGGTSEINNSVLEAALELTGAPMGVIGEVDPEGTMKIIAVREKGKPSLGERLHERLIAKGMPFKGYLAKVLTQGKPLIVDSTGPDGTERIAELLTGHPGAEMPIGGMLFIPFKIMGQLIGAIILANKPGGFSPEDKDTMVELANILSVGRSKILALSAAMRNTTDGVALMDRNGVLSMVNPAMVRMFHYKASELEGRSLLGIFLDPGSGSPLGEAIAGAVIEGTWNGEALGLRRDGTMFPVHMTVTVVEEASGPRTGFMLMVRDITDEKATQDRSQLYIETAEVMLLALDLEGKATMINRKGEEIIGRPRGDIVGKDWFQNCVPEQHRAEARRAFDAIFEGPNRLQMHGAQVLSRKMDPKMKDAPEKFETRGAGLGIGGNTYPVLDEMGKERLMRWEHSLLKNRKGLVVGALFSGTDITEQKMVEDKLRASEELYKTILRLSPDAIVMSDMNAIIQDVSKKACEIYGTDDSYDMIGKNSIEFIVPEEREKAARGMQRTLKEGTIKVNYHLMRKDGVRYPAELSTTIVWGPDGKISGFLGIIRDLTEHEAATARLRTAEEQYRRIFETSPVGIVRISLVDGRPLLVNQVAAEHSGFKTADEMLDQVEVRPPIPKEAMFKLIERIKRTGQLKDFAVDIPRPDNSVVSLIMSGVISPNADYIDLFGIDVTKAKETESKLHEVEESFRSLMDTSFISFARFSIRDGKISYANKKLLERYGYDNIEDFRANVSSRDMFTDEQRMVIRERLIKDGVLPNFETEVRGKDGQKVYALTYSRMDRKTGNIDAISVDITDLKMAERRAIEAEQMYKTLFGAISTAVAKVDMRTGKVVMANDAAARMFGYPSVEEFMHEFETRDDFGKRFFNVQPLLEKYGSITNREYVLPRKDGSQITVMVSATLDRTKGEVIFSANDVSQFRQIQERLGSKEELYTRLIDMLPVAIMKVNLRTGRIMMANEAATRLYGYTSMQKMMDSINSNAQKQERILKLVETMKRGEVIRDREFEFVRDDGSRVKALLSATPDFDADEVTFSAIDITEARGVDTFSKAEGHIYRHLFENTPVGISRIYLKEWKIVKANRAMMELLGARSMEELSLPANMDNYYPKELMGDYIKELKESGPLSNVELEILRIDGGKRNILAYACIDESGEFLDNVVIDITRLKEAESRLSEAEGTFWQMFKACSVGQARIGSEDGKVRMCNDAFARMLGYGTVEIVLKEFKLEAHVADMDAWKGKVVAPAGSSKGVGWLPAPTSTPTVGTKDINAKSMLIGIIKRTDLAMVRKDGKAVKVNVSGVLYMGMGYMDLTFVETGP